MSLLVKIAGALPISWVRFVSSLQFRIPGFGPVFQWAANRFRNQDLTIPRGAAKGLRFNSGNENAGYVLGTYEPEVQALLQELVTPGMTVYDVGAHVGFVSILAAKLVGCGGRVVSFEPLAENARQLTHNVRINGFQNVSVREEAAGSAHGVALLQVAAVLGHCKLASVGAVAGKTGELSVPVRSIDDLVSGGIIASPQFVKIDVEGAEDDVLAGMAGTIALQKPLLLIELHGTNVAIEKRLKSFNYQAVALGTGLGFWKRLGTRRLLPSPGNRGCELAQDQVKAIQEPAPRKP